MKNITKKQAEAQGYVFTTTSGGAIVAMKLGYTETGDVTCVDRHCACTLKTVLKRIGKQAINA